MTHAHAVALAVLLPWAAAAADAPPPLTAAVPQRPGPVQAVLVQTVHFAADAARRTLPGVICARTVSDLGFRVGGKITSRLVDNGAVVRAGHVLALLDPTDLALQSAQADAEYAAARIARDTTQAELRRVTTLRRAGWSTGSDADRQMAAAAEAVARLDRADRARALARNAQAYGTLRADADGVVTATLAEPGQVVAAGQPVIRLAQFGAREVAVAIPETLVAAARTPATVTVWALPGVTLAAHLRELSPNADPATRTYAARYALDGPDVPDVAMLGMTATVTLSTEGSPATRVPLGAVTDQGTGPTVFVVDGQTRVTPRPVTIGRMDATGAWVTAGLAENDRIVAAGAQKLDPDTQVRIVTRLDR